MSVSIDISNFRFWSEVFSEIERREKSTESTVKDQHEQAKIKKKIAKTRSLSVREPEARKHNRMEELATERGANGQKRDVKPMSARRISEPCFPSTFDPAKVMKDPRLTDAAKQLSHEKLALLY